MNDSPIYSIDKSWSRDGLQVFADRVVIEQRMRGATGTITLRRDQITEVRPEGMWTFDGKGYRLHLRVGSKKYVIRRLRKEEAAAAAEAIG